MVNKSERNKHVKENYGLGIIENESSQFQSITIYYFNTSLDYI